MWSSEPLHWHREANQLVEEFMLLANMAAAKAGAGAHPDRALLRRHPPPQERQLLAAANYVKALVRFLYICSFESAANARSPRS